MRVDAEPTASIDTPDLAAAVRELSRRLDQLVPGRRDPEQFHREKSELVDELRRLAEVLKARAGR